MEELEKKRAEYEALVRKLRELQEEIAEVQTRAIEAQGVIKYLIEREKDVPERPEITD